MSGIVLLANCSLVCRRWKTFLDRHVWNVGRGAARRRRITENWMIRMPTITEIRSVGRSWMNGSFDGTCH